MAELPIINSITS